VLLALTAMVAGAYLLSALDAQETRVLEDSSRNRRITILLPFTTHLEETPAATTPTLPKPPRVPGTSGG